MKEHFDLIAMPKGQVPGGPIQASDGSWYLVLPAFADLDEIITVVKRDRAGRPVTSAEITRAIGMLSNNTGDKT